MKAFPMFIKTTGRRVVIVGGGEQAAQKARLMLKTDADLILAAPGLDAEWQGIVDRGLARQHTGAVNADTFAGAAMVFVATGCAGADVAAHALAKAARAPVNVVDRPDLCDLTTPSIVDRDPVVVAIGTEGTAPVLARHVKTLLDERLGSNLGDLAALAGRLRGAVAAQVPRPHRRGFWRWVFSAAPRTLWDAGQEAEAATLVKAAIEKGGQIPDGLDGAISFVGVGDGVPDLLTLRAVQRLQEADVIFHDPRDLGILELARRDAERVAVPMKTDAHWPGDLCANRMIGAAKGGARVVRLVRGDDAAQRTARLEAAAAYKAGVPVDATPGSAPMDLEMPEERRRAAG